VLALQRKRVRDSRNGRSGVGSNEAS
jgi:hypothetical protein